MFGLKKGKNMSTRIEGEHILEEELTGKLENKGGYDPEYDALPEPEGGYTKEYIEEAIGKWESEIVDIEVKINALTLMVEEGKQSKRKEEFENNIKDFNRQIKVKQTLIEKGRIKIGELALKKEIKTGKYE